MSNKNIKVCIIDDSLMYRTYLKKLLKEYNASIEIFEYSDNLYLLQEIANIKPDIIISDIELKYIKGFSLVHIIKNILKIEVPIILISGVWNNKYGIYLAKKFGQFYILSKNFSNRMLYNLLNNLIYKLKRDVYKNIESTNIEKILSLYIQSLEKQISQKELLEDLSILNIYIHKKDDYIYYLFKVIDNYLFINNVYIIYTKKNTHYIYRYSFSKVHSKCLKYIDKHVISKRNTKLITLENKNNEYIFTDIKKNSEELAKEHLYIFRYKKIVKEIFKFRIYLEYIYDNMLGDFLNILKLFLDNSVRNLLLTEYVIYSSQIDQLTQLYNRVYLYEFLEELEKNFQNNQIDYSLILIDIDFFKEVNDTYGHIAGDYVLKEISSILVDNVRPFDEVFRIGGEEILIVLPNTELNIAKKVADRLLQQIRNYNFVFEDKEIKIRISAGIYSRKLLNEDDKPLDIIKYADYYLYQAKRNGRDQVKSPF